MRFYIALLVLVTSLSGAVTGGEESRRTGAEYDIMLNVSSLTHGLLFFEAGLPYEGSRKFALFLSPHSTESMCGMC